MKNKQKTRWWVDAVLFTGFILTFFLDLTGLELHQWIGVFVAALAVYHLLTHWDWVSAVTQRFFGKTSDRARQYYALDATLMLGVTAIAATGLVISTWLNLTLANYTAWLNVHIVASIATLLALAVKLALHNRWIVSTARGALARQPASLARRATAPAREGAPAVAAPRQTTPRLTAPRLSAPRPVSRREFLGVMGVAGLASLLALFRGAEGLMALSGGNAQGASSNAAQIGSGAASTSSQGSTSQSSSDSLSGSSTANGVCSVSCNRRCAYPGHCRRYTDSNDNGYCDLGECA